MLYAFPAMTMTPTTPSRLPCAAALGVTLAVSLACLALDAHAARLALVVGNDNYQHVTKLRNARNDATALAREFETAGFAVTRVLDANRDTLNESIDGFLRRIEKGDEVVFFFSGHGSQPPQTGPFLLPVDIKVTSDRAIVRDGLSLEQLVDDLNKRARFSLIIIDACRDDPFRETTAGRSLPPGSALGRIEPPKGSMIIMAASKGQQALDRLSDDDKVPNGLFTRELMKQIRTPGLSAADMLKKVRSSVEGAAASVNHAQRPSLVDESSTDFYFHAPRAVAGAQAPTVVAQAPLSIPVTAPMTAPATAPVTAPVTVTVAVASPMPVALLPPPVLAVRAVPDTRPAAVTPSVTAVLAAPVPTPAPAAAKPAGNDPQREFDTWDRAASSRLRADYEQYLAQYPAGRYADQARAALRKLAP